MKLDTINAHIAEWADNFSNINNGGCGASAAILAEHLIHLFPDLEIKTCSMFVNDNVDVDEARENMIDEDRFNAYRWHDQGVHFTHIWVEFNHRGRRYAADSDGVVSVQYMQSNYCESNPGSFHIDEMAAMSAPDTRGWNCCFDRTQIEDMITLAGDIFAPLRGTFA